MLPLSKALVSVLEACLRSRATHVEISASGLVRLLRGGELLGQHPLPTGGFAPFVGELLVLGAQNGARSEILVRSPMGPMKLAVEIDSTQVRIFFARDSSDAENEATFLELMRHLDTVGADRVECARGQATFLRNAELIAVAPLYAQAIARLVAHGRALIGPGLQAGSAVLLAAERHSRTLHVEIADAGVAFSVGP